MKHVEDPEEQMPAELGAPLEQVRARHASCPPLTLLRAAAGDALPAERKAELEQHLQQCALCQALAADLQGDELTAPTAAGAQRIRARVDAEIHERQRRLWAWSWRPAAGLASIAVVAWIGWMALQRQKESTVEQPVRMERRTNSTAAAIPLEMPEAKLRPSVALLSRGEDGPSRYLQDLGPAMEAYRNGDYERAAREFVALAPRYPTQVEAAFYSGVTQLKLGANDKAVEALERARALNDPAFAGEIAWYLGIAYQRAGRLQAAHDQFAQLCRAQGEYAVRACAAAKLTADKQPPR